MIAGNPCRGAGAWLASLSPPRTARHELSARRAEASSSSQGHGVSLPKPGPEGQAAAAAMTFATIPSATPTPNPIKAPFFVFGFLMNA